MATRIHACSANLATLPRGEFAGSHPRNCKQNIVNERIYASCKYNVEKDLAVLSGLRAAGGGAMVCSKEPMNARICQCAFLTCVSSMPS
jgi:hypothetical protein